MPPGSYIGAITPEQRKQIINTSPVAGHYEKVVDRESAYEMLKGRAEKAAVRSESAATDVEEKAQAKEDAAEKKAAAAEARLKAKEERVAAKAAAASAKQTQSVIASVVKATGSTLGRELVRGVMGSLLGSGSRRR